MDSLPTGAFRHSFAGPGLPGGLRRGERVTIRFVVRPDGTPDLASLKILGSDDAGYRQRVERAIRRADLLPMRVNGCPVFSLVEVTIAKAG